MDPRLVTPLAHGCPWSGWALPDIKHCEANLCSWITAPADTWSNLAYLAVGIWIFRRARPGGPLAARGLGAVVLAVGATSFAFHASYTFAGQFLDYAGMFLLTGWWLSRALMLEDVLGESAALRAWLGLVAVSLIALLLFRRLDWGVQTLVLVQTLAIVALELRLNSRRPDKTVNGPLHLAMLLLVAAYACWHVDHTDRFCRPENHFFQWHAAWHLLTAAALAAAWEFSERIDLLRAAKR